MKRAISTPDGRQSGVSLVEIMVALAIGMAASLVILQVFSLSEGRKRTTTGAADAQGVGAVMFHQLKHEVAQAGYGFNSLNLLGCNLVWNPNNGGTLVATPVPLVPVFINPPTSLVPAGDSNTDTLLIMYGDGNGQPQGNAINGITGLVYAVQGPGAFAVADRVIAAPAACAAANLVLDRVAATTSSAVTLTTGGAGATLYNMGPSPTVLAYAVRGGNLTVCDYLRVDCGTADVDDETVWMPVASNIVSLRAQYVRNDGTVDRTTPTTACGWASGAAIRLAIVGRSTQPESSIVTRTALNAALGPANAPTWAGEADAPLVGSDGALGPDAAADEPWKRYRYKVLWGVLPIRNVVWMGAVCP